MSELTQEQARRVWLEAAEKVKDRVIAPTLYRALELGVGITLDGGEFVIGFATPDIPMAGHLRSSQHQAVVEQCISDVLKKKVRMRIIEGTTLQEYENYKKIKATAEATNVSMSERRQQERQVELGWEEVGEQITRGYARLHMRQLAQSKGQFIKWAFGVINNAIERLDYREDSDEIHKRSLSRVFEKFATVVEVPSAMLAYEFFKLRDEGKLS